MKRKSICLVLTAAMLLSLASCGGGGQTPPAESTGSTADTPKEGETEQQATWKDDTSPITFDVYVNASWFDVQWLLEPETRSTAFQTEKTGVTINFITPTGSEAEKMNTMIASGEVPDMILANVYDKETQALIDAGLCLPLNELADQYDKTFYDNVAPSQIGWFTHADGNIYDYPNFAGSYESAMETISSGDKEGIQKLAGDTCYSVRKDMYEAIGSPDMTTPEGFLDALVKAKEKFPEVNGKPMIPIELYEMTEIGCQGIDYIYSMAAVPRYTAEGKINDRQNDPEFIRWMKTLRKANEMGLVSKDIFIDKKAQKDEKLKAGQYFFCSSGKADIGNSNNYLWKDLGGKESGVYYIPIDAMGNSEGKDPTIEAKIMLDGWMNTYITTKCKDPARALRFLNYALSAEGQNDAYWGIEGTTFDMVDGEPTFKPFVYDGSVPNEELVEKYCVYGNQWTWWSDKLDEYYPEDKGDPVNIYKEYTAKYITVRPEFNGLEIPADQPEALMKSNIDLEWGITLTKLLTAPSDEEFDKIMTAYNAKREKLGWQQVLAKQQEMLDSNREKLGITEFN